MQGGTTSLLIREEKINTTMRYLYTPTRMAKMQDRQYRCLQGWGSTCWKCIDGSHQHNTEGKKPDTILQTLEFVLTKCQSWTQESGLERIQQGLLGCWFWF